MSTFQFVIDLPVRSEWENVERIRSSVQACFSAVFQSLEGCERLAMVTGELLENAVKYGTWRPGDSRNLRLQVTGTRNTACIRVENPIDGALDSVDALLQTLEWMSGFDDTEEMYRTRLLECAGSENEQSRLGLMRIVYEGDCRLRAEVEAEWVAVVADFKLNAAA